MTFCSLDCGQFELQVAVVFSDFTANGGGSALVLKKETWGKEMVRKLKKKNNKNKKKNNKNE